jgi:hypothetical protein
VKDREMVFIIQLAVQGLIIGDDICEEANEGEQAEHAEGEPCRTDVAERRPGIAAVHEGGALMHWAAAITGFAGKIHQKQT